LFVLKINFVWLKPKLLFTYMYSTMFVALSGSQANALQFGESVITASTKPGTTQDPRLQKFIAIAITGVICLLQVYSRSVVVRFNNVITIYKLLLLSLVTVLGWCAIGGLRTTAAKSYQTSYGKENLQNIFQGTTNSAYGNGIALLVIQRAFLGYENANFVCPALVTRQQPLIESFPLGIGRSPASDRR
jgi:amino acid transporter